MTLVDGRWYHRNVVVNVRSFTPCDARRSSVRHDDPESSGVRLDRSTSIQQTRETRVVSEKCHVLSSALHTSNRLFVSVTIMLFQRDCLVSMLHVALPLS